MSASNEEEFICNLTEVPVFWRKVEELTTKGKTVKAYGYLGTVTKEKARSKSEARERSLSTQRQGSKDPGAASQAQPPQPQPQGSAQHEGLPAKARPAEKRAVLTGTLRVGALAE